MHPELEEKIKTALKNSRGLKDETIKSYINTINSVMRLNGVTNKVKTLHFLKTPKNVIKSIIESPLAPNTMLKFLSTIISVMRTIKGDGTFLIGMNAYVAEFTKRKKAQHEELMKQEPTTKQRANWLTDKEVQYVSETLLEAKDLGDYVMWELFFGNIPPRRAMDYANMKITSNPKKTGNYLVRDENGFKSFVFQDYKNSASKGRQTFTREWIITHFGRKIIDILDLYISSKKNGEYLLRHLSPNAFSKYFARITYGIIDKKVSVNLARHMYISKQLALAPFETRKKVISDFMSNSVEIQALYRKRVAKKEEDKIV